MKKLLIADSKILVSILVICGIKEERKRDNYAISRKVRIPEQFLSMPNRR